MPFAASGRAEAHFRRAGGHPFHGLPVGEGIRFRRRGTDPAGREVGEWIPGGVTPRFLPKCEKMGVALPPEVYAAEGD